MTKVAVIGSRDFQDYNLLKETLDKLDIACIVSGGARGADSLAEKYSQENNIEMTVYKPDWQKYGKSAGFIRNKDIIDDCDITVAFWDGKSRGTQHSISLAQKANKEVHIINF